MGLAAHAQVYAAPGMPVPVQGSPLPSPRVRPAKPAAKAAEPLPVLPRFWQSSDAPTRTAGYNQLLRLLQRKTSDAVAAGNANASGVVSIWVRVLPDGRAVMQSFSQTISASVLDSQSKVRGAVTGELLKLIGKLRFESYASVEENVLIEVGYLNSDELLDGLAR